MKLSAIGEVSRKCRLIILVWRIQEEKIDIDCLSKDRMKAYCAQHVDRNIALILETKSIQL